MNIPEIITANGASFLLLLILFFSSNKTIRAKSIDYKLYQYMLLFALCQTILEPVAFLIDGRESFRIICRIINSILYFNNIVFAFCWTIYTDYKLFGSKERLKKIYSFIGIPAIIISICSILNIFFPIFFRITPEFTYERTPFSIVVFIFVYLYLYYGVILIYLYRNRFNKYLFMPAIVFVLPITIGGILQIVFYGYSFAWLGASIGLVFMYINVQNEITYIDMLSGLFTRQYLNRYLMQYLTEDNDNPIIGVMFDIDHFKRINDTYGHLVGDEAIGLAGKILRDTISSKSIATRFAGDEFVIVCRNKTIEEVEEYIRKINQITNDLNESGSKPYKLSFSSGYSKSIENDTIDSFLKRLDISMYENKKEKQKIEK